MPTAVSTRFQSNARARARRQIPFGGSEAPTGDLADSTALLASTVGRLLAGGAGCRRRSVVDVEMLEFSYFGRLARDERDVDGRRSSSSSRNREQREKKRLHGKDDDISIVYDLFIL